MLQSPQTDFILKLKDWLAERFPKLAFSEAELVQLTPRFESKDITPEQSVVLNLAYNPEAWQFTQMQRTGASLNCLRLLMMGEGGYEEFVQVQEQGLKPRDNVLSKEDYLKLTQPFQNLDSLYVEALKVATIIQMQTLSPRVVDLANEHLGQGKFSSDSTEFLADCFKDYEKGRLIFPLVQDLESRFPGADNRAKIQRYMQEAFSSGQHFRHMLYTECNQNGFVNLFEKIKQGQYKDTNDDGFCFWRDFWLLNVMGFRGNVNHKGSLYFTQNTFNGINMLLDSIYDSFKPRSSAIEMWQKYLEKRATGLGLVPTQGKAFVNKEKYPLNPAEQDVGAHLGAMMRRFSPDDGELVKSVMMALRTHTRDLMSLYSQAPDGVPTPTYVPAVLANIYDLRKQQYEQHEGFYSQRIQELKSKTLNKDREYFAHDLAVVDAVIVFLPFYLKALQMDNAKRQSADEGYKRTPLCFKAVADKAMLKQLFSQSPCFDDYNVLAHFEPEIDDKGMVKFKARPKPAITPSFDQTQSAGGAASAANTDRVESKNKRRLK